MEYSISKNMLENEREVLLEIQSNLKERKPFYLLAGAGSGKTYTLIETILYVLSSEANFLTYNNKKIGCITYTNNAKDEISTRLGNTNLVVVSTIHSFLWDIIGNYQDALVEIHKENIINIINEVHQEYLLNSKPAYVKFRTLEGEELEKICCDIVDKEHLYYCLFKFDAELFWFFFEVRFGYVICSKIKSDKVSVVKILKGLLKIKKLEVCLQKINDKVDGFCSVRYSLKNKEKLHYNTIGHDTLLNYSLRMVEKNKYLADIIIDIYPYIFIDEYQDTSRTIVDFFNKVLQHSENEGRLFTFGVFGDPEQDIYSAKNNMHCENLYFKVSKNSNRRSHEQIINLSNLIRGSNSYISQRPFFENKNNGSAIINVLPSCDYTKSNIEDIISSYNDNLNLTLTPHTACLVLKNRMLANLCGFSELYEVVCKIYSEEGIHYERVNEEFVVQDLNKMGLFSELLYSYAYPLYLISFSESKSVEDLFKYALGKDFSYREVSYFLDLMKKENYTSLYDFLSSINDILNSDCEGFIKDLWLSIFPSAYIPDFNSSVESNFIIKANLHFEENNKLITDLLNLPINEIFCWLDHVNGKSRDNKKIFMTCHASKGLEFENVLIFLEDSMFRKKKIFSGLFNSDMSCLLDDPLEEARRLLYVSVSRAIRNVNVYLYTDEVIDRNIISANFPGVNIKLH